MKVLSVLAFLGFLSTCHGQRLGPRVQDSTHPSSASTPTTTNSASAATNTYLVYPISGASSDQLDSIKNTLSQAPGVKSSYEISISSMFIGVMDSKTAGNLKNLNSAVRLSILTFSSTYFFFIFGLYST